MPDQQTATPPLPPSVTAQQSPALSQYAEKAMGSGAAQEQGGASKAFVKWALDQIAALMTKIAKIIAVEQPELMPVVTRIAGGFKVLETEFNKTQQGQGAPIPPGSEPTPSAPEDSATAMGM